MLVFRRCCLSWIILTGEGSFIVLFAKKVQYYCMNTIYNTIFNYNIVTIVAIYHER